MKKIIFLFLLLFSLTLVGQEFKQASPISKSIALPVLQKADTMDVSGIDWMQIQSEDAIAIANNLPLRAGISLNYDIDPYVDGQWSLLPNNKVVWRYKLTVPGAKSVILSFDQWKLSEDAELFVYNDNGYIVGAYTHNHNDPNGGIRQMSSVPVPGDVITIELVENANPNTLPAQPKTKSQTQGSITIQQFSGNIAPIELHSYSPRSIIHISDVVLIYNDQVNDSPDKDLGDAGSCQVNINCSPEGDNWQVQKRGVARILYKDGTSWYYCSGTLINNTQNNGTPYFLTAYHCGATASAADHNQWQFYFNYERPGCANTGTPPNNLITGCVKRAGGDISGGSDFQLVELNSTPSLSWNPYYNGWDKSGTASSSGVGIHHPAGDAKKISTYTTTLGTGTWPNGGMSSAHWTVKWASTTNGYGCVEGGSSGSPLFDNNKRVIGTLTGGNSSCGNQASATDYYGKFSVHWTANGTTNDKQLKPWLDPLNSNPTTLNGFDPNANTNPPVANFSATPTSIMAGESVQFTDISTNYPTSWKWTFQGGYPSTSTIRSPVISYVTPGTYNVKLVVSNQYGSDSIVKNAYITVTSYTAPSTTVTIGTGTTSGGVYPLGIGISASYVNDAAIYLNSEIGGSGIIKKIAWKPGNSRTDTRNIKIYMKHTSSTSFSETTTNDLLQDATLVYDGTFTPNIAGWFTITLQTPFNYIKSQNLMVITVVNGTAANRASNCSYTTSTNRHLQCSRTVNCLDTVGTVNNNRPNIQLTIDPYTEPVANFAGLNAVFSEDFESTTFPPTGWTAVNGDTDNSGLWESSTDVNHTFNGLSSAYHGWGDGTTYQKGWFITPAIILPSGNPKLSFWSYNTFPTYYTKSAVLISTTTSDTSAFTQIWSPSSVTESWVQTILDLSSYAGQTVYIAFKYSGTDGHGWYLDDVKIQTEEYTQLVTYEGDPVTIIDKSSNNPTLWEWTIPGSIDNYLYTQNVNTFYNVAGQYDVSLKIGNPAGEDIKNITNFVKVIGRTPIARLKGTGNLKDIYTRPFIPKGGTVNYTDKSQRVPTGWNWSFPNGVPSSSTLQNPSNIKYISADTFNVSLNVYNAHGSDTITYLNYVVVGGKDTCTNFLETDNIAVYNADSGFLPGHCDFVSGTTHYHFYKYSEYYKNAYPGKIYGFGMYVYKAQGTGKTIKVTVWSDNGGIPGTVLYTETRNITSFTENSYNVITFTTPVSVSGNFFIGYELNYDASHNYTTHQFCGLMAAFRNTTENATAFGSFGTATPGTWYSFQDVLGNPSSLMLDLIFEYTDPGVLAAVESITGCGTGSVKVISSSKTNQTFYLTDNAGTTLQSWTGNDSIHIFSGLSNGIYRGKVKIGAQESPLSDPVTLTNVSASEAGTLTVPLTEICLGSSTGIMTLSGYSGNIQKWQKRVNMGSWIDIPSTSSTFSEIPSSTGTWQYRAFVQNATCSPDSSNIVSIIVDAVTVGGTLTSTNTEVCINSNSGAMTLSGNVGNIVRWEKRVNGGVWQNISNTTNTYNENLTTAGTYEFRVLVQNGTCASAYSNVVTIAVDEATVGGTLTSTNTEVCINSNSGVMTLSGNVGNIVRWEKRVNGGTWQNISNTTNTYNENLTTAGTYEFRVLVQSGTCASAYSNVVTIAVDEATVGGTLTSANTEVCINSNSGAMTLSGNVGNIVRWEKRVNGGVWQNISNITNTYNENLTTAGTYEFRVLVQNGACASAYSNVVTITVNAATVGGTFTSANTEVCINSNSGAMTLSGNVGNIVRWEKRVNGGTWQNISNTTNTYNENLTTAGTYEFRVLVQNGTCASAYSNLVTITVDEATVGGTLTSANTEVCINSNSGVMTLSGNVGNIVRWEKRVNGGVWQNISNTTNTYNENLTTAGTYDFRVLVQSGACASAYSNVVTIAVDEATVGGTLTSTNTEVCINSNSGVMTLSGNVGNIVRWEKRVNGGVWQNISNTTNTYNENLTTAGTYEFRVLVQNEQCYQEYSNILIINVVLPVTAGILNGEHNEICVNSSTGVITISGYDGTILKWQNRHNGGIWTDISNNTDTFEETINLAGLWEYRVIVGNGICDPDTSNIFVINVSETPISGTLIDGGEYCGAANPLLTIDGYTGTIVNWEEKINNNNWTIINNTLNSYSPVLVNSGTYKYRVKISNGSCPAIYSNEEIVQIYDSTIAGILVYPYDSLCIGESTGLITDIGYVGNIIKWQYNIDGGAWIDIPFTDEQYQDIPSTPGIWQYRAVVKNGVCAEAYSDPAIFYIFNIPVASFDYLVNSYTVNFTNTSQYANTYSWVFGDGMTSTEDNPIHIYSQDGIYNVSLIASNGICSDTSEQIIIVTYITIYDSNLDITLYPNPSPDGNIFLAFNNYDNESQISIKLVNQLGEIVKYYKDIKLVDKSLPLNLSFLSSGVYSIEIIYQNRQVVLPLIIVK